MEDHILKCGKIFLEIRQNKKQTKKIGKAVQFYKWQIRITYPGMEKQSCRDWQWTVNVNSKIISKYHEKWETKEI